MPKLQNVTNEELNELLGAIEDIIQRGIGISERLDKGYREEIEDTLGKLAAFNSMAYTATRLVSGIAAIERLQRQQRELDALRANAEGR